MKNGLVILFICLSVIVRAQQKFMVKGKITQTTSYCGGAAPSDEMLMECATPKSYPFKTLYVRKGNVNDAKNAVVLKFRADAEGRFNFQLPEGIYCIIQEEQLKELDLDNFKSVGNLVIDEKCLKDWWARPLYLLSVKGNRSGVEINFHHPCFVPGDIPCFTYIGPYPP